MSHIAQLNVGRILYPMDDPRMAGFANELDRINALAEALERLEQLRREGPGAAAFDFRSAANCEQQAAG